MPEPGTAFKECDGRYFSDKGNRSDAGGQAGRAPWAGSQSLLKAAFTIFFFKSVNYLFILCHYNMAVNHLHKDNSERDWGGQTDFHKSGKTP